LLSPQLVPTLIEPTPGDQPPGTQVKIDYRGADGFLGAGGDPFDAQTFDAYGDLNTGTTIPHGDGLWTSDISGIDGARFVQMRFTFVNNIGTGQSPTLESLGLAWEE
jgi:hypothetical protein